MNEQVKRYISTRLLLDAEGCNQSVAPNTYVRASDYDALHAEAEALRKDAERYRWLRDPCSGAEHVIYYSRGDYGRGLMSGSMLDAAIDAALSQQAEPERVTVPVELLQDLHDLASDAVDHHRQAFAGYKLERQANMDATVDKARALLASHAEGGNV